MGSSPELVRFLPCDGGEGSRIAVVMWHHIVEVRAQDLTRLVVKNIRMNTERLRALVSGTFLSGVESHVLFSAS